MVSGIELYISPLFSPPGFQAAVSTEENGVLQRGSHMMSCSGGKSHDILQRGSHIGFSVAFNALLSILGRGRFSAMFMVTICWVPVSLKA